MTSANVVFYRVFDKDDNVVKEYRQNIMCKSRHKDELLELKPYSDYEIQASGLDEYESPWVNNRENLTLFLKAKGLIKRMNYKEALKVASQKDKTLEAGRELSKIILVRHFDGSVLEFHDACWEKIDEEWYAVYTEHNGCHVYHYEDVKSIEEVVRKIVFKSKG